MPAKPGFQRRQTPFVNCWPEGDIIVLCDLRGIGETEDKAEFNDPKYYNKEYRNAMLALHNGRPLVGQRATDILSAVNMVNADPMTAGLPVRVIASGVNTLPAQHAAVFSDIEVLLTGSIRSWKEILNKPLTRDWYSYIIPGVLKYYDLPQLQILTGGRIRHLD
jgi:hypothetical protein